MVCALSCFLACSLKKGEGSTHVNERHGHVNHHLPAVALILLDVQRPVSGCALTEAQVLRRSQVGSVDTGSIHLYASAPQGYKL